MISVPRAIRVGSSYLFARHSGGSVCWSNCLSKHHRPVIAVRRVSSFLIHSHVRYKRGLSVMVTTRSTADEKKPLLQNGKTKADINSDQVLPSRSMNDIPEGMCITSSEHWSLRPKSPLPFSLEFLVSRTGTNCNQHHGYGLVRTQRAGGCHRRYRIVAIRQHGRRTQ